MSIDQGDDIEVPIISITDGWDVDDIVTEDDCDDAHAVLTAMIVSIESRIDDLTATGGDKSVECRRAKSALRWKKAAMNVVNTKRGKIRRAEKLAETQCRDRQVLDYFRAMYPEELKEAMCHVNAGTVSAATKRKETNR